MLGFFHRKLTFEMMDAMAEDSLNQFMDRAVKHYSSLFWLPPLKKAILLLALLCIGGQLLSALILFPYFDGIVNGLFLGLSLFFTNLVFDYIVSRIVLRQDPLFNLRRTIAVSFFCWIFWLFFIFIGVASAILSDLLSWWVELCLLGFSAVLVFRLIVFMSTSSMDYKRHLVASFFQPFACIIPFMIFWTKMDYITVFRVWPFFFFSPAICLIASFLFVSSIDRVGKQMLGVSSITLFKAFLLNWVADLNVPFEELLEKLGEEQDVEVSLIKFDSSKPKAAIIVPSVHPGPFKNVGSSLLPSMLKVAFEREFNCVGCVPLGLLGHELDLASQPQNQKIISHVVEAASFTASETRATPSFSVSDGFATACCQIFGNTALLSFTLAPKTTEDLPKELGLFASKEAKKHGLDCCVVVNAHNSIDETANMREASDSLKKVAVKCLEKVASLKRLPFEVGATNVIPKEFSLKDGMGPGGITVVVVRVSGLKTAYVVVDGNNMISGLRESILSVLRSMGFDEGEIFTTDTHAVSAVILGSRGYHPIGEAINHEKLIGYIKEAAHAAVANLERCKAECRRIKIPNVKVIGKTRLESLSLLTDRTLKKAKKTIIPILTLSGLLLTLVLMIF